MSYSALAGLWVVEDECLVGLLASCTSHEWLRQNVYIFFTSQCNPTLGSARARWPLVVELSQACPAQAGCCCVPR